MASCRSIQPNSGHKQNLEHRAATAVSTLPRMNGVNIAGLEFGIDTNGGKSGSYVSPPLDQIPHFITGKVNALRFPIGWQYIQVNDVSDKAPLDQAYLTLLDKYVMATTKLGAFAIIDLHNYARRDGKVVGQSDLGADTLVDLWTRLAAHYKDQPKVLFGLMNEPHDLTSSVWFGVIQSVVTAIRKAGANNNILLPGNAYQHLATFASDYNNGLSAIKNPDGSHTGLILEIHQYFDQDGSGTSTQCTQDHIAELQSVVTLLKNGGRQVFITEAGGGNTKSCSDIVSKFVTAATKAYPTVVGTLVWAAGSFAAVCPFLCY
ncbi:family 5 glycoside hydrolase [Melampsora larici-populina 98AG31]|uniref:cellulase n=1 Tax=Melampsora larici-populina (strain 98AG31 / pathotype 3-4-7) TaxID=747676 RepID=F4RGI3_MELLP|nr:family 5 glycoside hydrolase [Melampsora larici-populina 98AG31]EGG08510.1 family 5 glycoside hydrolase [Melampsora larici-populina 98AG31]